MNFLCAERAQYEIDLARRRYVAVEPDNRLVARSLEREWNEKLAHLDQLEREYTAWSTHAIRPVRPEERQRILAWAQDVPAVWHAPTTTHTERKQLLRCLVRDVTLTRRDNIITIALRWQTGALTTFDIPRLRKSWEVRQTAPRAVARIRELAPAHTDQQIAACRNADGLQAGLGGPFTQRQVGRHKDCGVLAWRVWGRWLRLSAEPACDNNPKDR